jgi:hypothetical protein
MSDYFVVKPLNPHGIPQAFVLVSIFDKGLSQDTWCEYAAAVVGKSGNGADRGIMTVQSEEGCIYGLSVHHLKNELRRGRILRAGTAVPLHVAETAQSEDAQNVPPVERAAPGSLRGGGLSQRAPAATKVLRGGWIGAPT